ncbi:MAG: dephospho-CoA kinase [Proteobacteria bacterium]|jgi:dephospho-CoA kinase|nr:dephospho-CoA kinase [Pseudomonadota bacterium]
MVAVRLGLTGGIGSGKSTVAQLLVQAGAAHVDADAIARNVTAAGGSAIAAIRATFGDSLIGPDGALERNRMRALAFADSTAKKKLEAIVHPLVGLEAARQAQQAVDAGHRLLVFDIPLLVESGRWRQQLDRIAVVDCEPSTQVARVAARNGLTQQAIEAIIAAQAPRLHRLAAADCVIYNEAITLDELGRKTRQLAQRFGL